MQQELIPVITVFSAWANLHRPPQLGLLVAEDTQDSNYNNCTGSQYSQRLSVSSLVSLVMSLILPKTVTLMTGNRSRSRNSPI